LISLKAASRHSQALCLSVQRVNFLIESRHLRSWRVSIAQLIDCLADGEFVYFSHRKILADKGGSESCRANAALPSR
jgi:hypothetical protein